MVISTTERNRKGSYEVSDGRWEEWLSTGMSEKASHEGDSEQRYEDGKGTMEEGDFQVERTVVQRPWGINLPGTVNDLQGQGGWGRVKEKWSGQRGQGQGVGTSEATVGTLAFIPKKMRNHRRFLGRGVTWRDLCFNGIILGVEDRLKWYKIGSREASQEVIAGIQVKYNGSLNQGMAEEVMRVPKSGLAKGFNEDMRGRGAKVDTKVAHTQLWVLSSILMETSRLSLLDIWVTVYSSILFPFLTVSAWTGGVMGITMYGGKESPFTFKSFPLIMCHSHGTSFNPPHTSRRWKLQSSRYKLRFREINSLSRATQQHSVLKPRSPDGMSHELSITITL